MTGSFRLLVLLLVVAGCGERTGGHEAAAPPPAEPLIGVWLRPIVGQDGYEGYQFERDGAVRFVNMFSLEGVRWERAGADSLRVWSATERYPQPATTDYRIVTVTPQQLVLVRPGGGAESYVRPTVQRPADRLVGRWTGPEGTFVDVTPAGDAYRLVIRSLDSLSAYTGEATGEGIAFTRAGVPCRLDPRTGRETGLTGLLDEETCVVVAPGEGYCRRLGGPAAAGDLTVGVGLETK